MTGFLYAYLFWLDLPLGALAFLMIYPLTGGGWGAVTRRILEAMASTVPLFALLVLPILIWPARIYAWADLGVDHGLSHQAAYLNPAAFRLRAALYFAIWIGLTLGVQRLRGDKLRALSATGLLLLAFSVTFAAIDWQMSTEPSWWSTIYGLVFLIGSALQGYAFLLIALHFAAREKALILSRKTALDVGNLLLALVVLWTYLSFMQYLIVWSGNLPSEATWFIHRIHGGWQWLVLAIAIFQFAAPFGYMLFRQSKRDTLRLARLGALVFAIRIVDHYWMLMPAFSPAKFELSGTAIASWFGIGAVWLGIFTWRFRRSPRFAESDADWSLVTREVAIDGA